MNTDLLSGITHDDIEKFSRSLSIINVNTPVGTVTPLWVAITGVINHNRLTEPVKKGKYEFVELLLRSGADPSKQCLLIPPICLACFEGQPKFVVLLLRHKAGPNEYAVYKYITKETSEGAFSYNYSACKLPIDCAIEESYSDCVEILIKYGAVFNKYMIDRAKRIGKVYQKKAKMSAYMVERFRENGKIVKLLEDTWTDQKEKDAATFIKNNCFMGKTPIRFVGLCPSSQ